MHTKMNTRLLRLALAGAAALAAIAPASASALPEGSWVEPRRPSPAP